MQEVTRKTEGRCGLTLVELLISITVIGLIGAVIAGLIVTGMDAYRSGKAQAELQREAAYAMNRMVQHTRKAAFLFIPNGRLNDTDMLAVSAGIDTDGDGLSDEDTGRDSTGDALAGIAYVDDDGDGLIDEGSQFDDDEDDSIDEDPINGIDDDGDGSIDEDPSGDLNGDGEPGIGGFDDDDDGVIDERPAEGHTDNDDEDEAKNEDPAEPVIFYLEGDALMENHPVYGVSALAHAVSQFRVQYLLGAEGDPQVNIILALSRGSGCEIVLKRPVHMENILQRQGMAVRGRRHGEQVFELTVNVVGSGSVSQVPYPPYQPNDIVVLRAIPGGDDWAFTGWSGDVPDGQEGKNPLALVMDGDKNITATFVEN